MYLGETKSERIASDRSSFVKKEGPISMEIGIDLYSHAS